MPLSTNMPLSVLSMCSVILLASASESGQNYSEDLFIKNLPDGRVMATFDFITSWDISPVTFAQPSLGKTSTAPALTKQTLKLITPYLTCGYDVSKVESMVCIVSYPSLLLVEHVLI